MILFLIYKEQSSHVGRAIKNIVRDILVLILQIPVFGELTIHI